MIKKWIVLLMFLPCLAVIAQDDDYVKDNFLRYQDWVYKSSIKTLQLRSIKYELGPALLEFNSEDQLELSFDDLDGGFKNYNYTVIHCDAAWNPSDLVSNEYMSGFFEDNISNYTYSTNTIQQYTHYQVKFPNTGMKISKSGNYIMFVYEDNNKENLVLTKRFMVYENLVAVNGNVHQAARSDEYFDKQEVDFSILTPNYKVTNPFVDMKVVITQNGRWDNAIYNMQPMFSNLNEFTYDYDDGSNCFEGSNEFRNFDDKSIKFVTQFVQKIYKDSNSFVNVKLMPEEVRGTKRYLQNDDLNGEFYIRNQEMDNNDTESDYCYVHFFLPYEVDVTDGYFYLCGKFNDWKLSKENKLKYNSYLKGYQCSMFLKQGYYNYQIAFSKDGKKSLDTQMIEGNHWETENDYTIFVYHRKLGTYYDQLVGIKKLNSIRK